MHSLPILAALLLPVADDPVTVEAALARLEERGNGMTDKDLAFVGQAVALEELVLTHSRRVTDAGLAHLAGLAKLRRLDLTGCRTITPAGLEVVAQLCPRAPR